MGSIATMRAAQFHRDTGKIQVNEVPIPEPDDTEILVKIKSASLCHSDIMAIEGWTPTPSSVKPITLGHEGAGVVDKLGSKVTGFKAGDRVGFLYITGCCWFNTVESCELKPGEWLAVVGCGGLGQAAVQYAKAMSAKVIALDINDETLAEATRVGADLTFNSATNPNYLDEIRKATGGGVHAAAVYSASIAAYENAKNTLRIGGLLMAVGLPAKSFPVNLTEIITGLYRLKGDCTGIPQRMAHAIDFTAKHGIEPNVVSFHKLEEVPDMIAKMRAQKSTGRMAVLF
ncbi:Alcohol dehydrogenase GroES-like domain-containing protein [Cladophialophora immunda]|nr:Alcohol dehydrogenase GroES-like domain-containing protein [Cladophialophora immunda]